MNVAAAIRDPEFQRQPEQVRAAALKKLGVSDEGISEYLNAQKSFEGATELQRQREQIASGKPEDVGGSGLPGVLTGIGKSIKQTAIGTAELGTRALDAGLENFPNRPAENRQQMRGMIDSLDEQRQAAETKGGSEQVGGFIGDVGTALIPGLNVEAGLTKAGVGLAGRTVARGASNALFQAAKAGKVSSDTGVAAATGSGLGLLGEGGMKTAEVLRNSRLKNFINLLQPKNEQQMEEAYRLAQRMSDEGIGTSAGSSYDKIANKANAARQSAGADVEKYLAANADDPLATQPIVDQLEEAAPGRLPGGEIPAAGRNLHRAYDSVRADMEKGMIGTVPQPANLPGNLSAAQKLAVLQGPMAPPASPGRPTPITRPKAMPLGAAVGEKRRIDKMLNHEKAIPASAQFLEASANAYRHNINKAFPEFGKMNMRDSELISITEMLKRAKTLESMPREAQIAGALGAGAAGRMSGPAAWLSRKIGSNPKWQTLSAGGKLVMAQLLSNSNMASKWLTAAGQAEISRQGGSND